MSSALLATYMHPNVTAIFEASDVEGGPMTATEAIVALIADIYLYLLDEGVSLTEFGAVVAERLQDELEYRASLP